MVLNFLVDILSSSKCRRSYKLCSHKKKCNGRVKKKNGKFHSAPNFALRKKNRKKHGIKTLDFA